MRERERKKVEKTRKSAEYLSDSSDKTKEKVKNLMKKRRQQEGEK